MQQHQLLQGTPEWHTHRASHYNASDAPAMLGCSPYKTRQQLLDELKTGITPEVDAATQQRYNEGHANEAKARPLAEAIVGQDLYPVVGTKDKSSASFDGLTICETIAFEHKTLNNDLREVMTEGCDGSVLPKYHRVQMEQQLIVSGAERVLFMASDWNGDELKEERHCWYTSDAALRNEITAGWELLEKDLATHEPAAATVEPIGRTPDNLPALNIEISGKVTSSNIAAFKSHALEVIQGINRNLSTDQQFADAEKTIKWCADVEDKLKAAKQHALSQTASIDELFRAIDAISAETRTTRLELNSLVKTRKDAIRIEIVQNAQSDLATHVQSLNQRLGKPYMPAIPAAFAEAIKGKRTIDSLRNAADTVLTQAKLAANTIADTIQANMQTLAAQTDFAFLFADEQDLVLKQADDLQATITARIAEYQQQQAEKERQEAEKQAQIQVQQEAPPAQPQSEPQMPEAAAPAKEEKPTLRLKQINERLGFTLSAKAASDLGVHPTKSEGLNLYFESDFRKICTAIIERLQQFI